MLNNLIAKRFVVYFTQYNPTVNNDNTKRIMMYDVKWIFFFLCILILLDLFASNVIFYIHFFQTKSNEYVMF